MSINTINLEDEILKTIDVYLEENRTFKTNKIIPYINSKFSKKGVNINENGIRNILFSLTKRKIIVEGSKLTKKDILRNSKRRAIYKFIRKNPGSIPHNIMKKLQISNYEIYWHLTMLEKFDFIKRGDIDGHDAYFATKRLPKEMYKQYIINKPKSKQIVEYLKQNNIGVTKTKIAGDLSMHFNTVSKYLKLLQDIDIIVKEKKSNKILYFPNF
jgi:predicted transcriptional regulator